MSILGSRAVALSVASVADRLLGDPPNQWHPVAWFGTTMTAVEARCWRDSRAAGLAYAAVGVGIGLSAGRLVRSPALALTISIAARQLSDIATEIGSELDEGELARARERLPALVGRDPRDLDEAGIAAAVIESVAENNVDAVIAPMFWTLVAGAPGALGYRAVNTMDAMVGHRSERYENFGWASARLDDVANWLPARVFAGLVAVTSPSRAAEVLSAVRRDSGAHPSPNAGVAEAAVAGALGVELGGPLRYGDRVENRPPLGRGPRPTAAAIRQACRVCDRAQVAAALLPAAAALLHKLIWVRRGLTA